MTGKNIFILNSRATGGKMELIVELLDRYLTTNPSFDDVVAYLEKLDAASTVVFSLSSFDNLVKNGRMPRLAGSIASKLNIRMLGTASAEGTIKIVGPRAARRRCIARQLKSWRRTGITADWCISIMSTTRVRKRAQGHH